MRYCTGFFRMHHEFIGLPLLGLLVIVLSGMVLPQIAVAEAQTLDSIVKVFVTCSYPDYASPWQKYPTDQVTGSGAIISESRILTNAHVIAYAVDIQVSRHGDPERYAAKTQYVDHERDLALLTVDDPDFFASSPPLPLAPLPELQSRVKVCGFPIGGKSLSVTEGVLSRIETGTYIHSLRENLVAQLDAPINSGNSGGPVLFNGKLIGLAMQALDDAENVGYCIPAPVIEQFFRDCDDGSIDGVPSLGVLLQPMMSPQLREALQLNDEASGGLVNQVLSGMSADGLIRADDVILEMDGYPIANDLTVDFEPFGRIDCSYLVTRRQVGATLPVTLLRDGQQQQLELELKNTPDFVAAPRYREDRQYLVCGGLVIAPLDIEYLIAFENVPNNIMAAALSYNETQPNRQQALVLVNVLPHPINQGYHELSDIILTEAMGETVRDFAHLQELLANPRSEWIDLRFDDHSRVILPVDELQQADAEIMRRYGIHATEVSMTQ